MKKLYNLLRKYLRTSYDSHIFGITFLLIMLFLLILIFLGERYIFIIMDFVKHDKYYLSTFYYVSISILTFLLVCGAWIQLGKLHNTSRCDFLLRIEKQYSAQNMVDARKLIRLLHATSCENYKKGEIPNKEIKKQIAAEILKFKDNINKNDDYSNLVDFLNYLEAISYFTNNHYIHYDDIKELSTSAITYYYDVYKDLIDEYRSERGNENLYHEIQKLSKKLKDYPD